MLIDFEFKNYSSFLNKTNLSLEADRITEFSETIFENEKLKLLPVAAIFGPNESGKSNLIAAFQYFQKRIIDNNFNGRVRPFLFVKDWEDSSFSIKFILNNSKIVHYEFTQDDKGKILFESLKIKKSNSKRSKLIFKRDKEEIKLNKSIKKYEKNLINLLDNNALLLNFLKNLKEESINEVYNWIEDIDTIRFSNISELDLANLNLKKLLKNPKSKERLLIFLNSFDSSIIDIDYDNESNPKFNTIHNHNNKKFILPITEESTGTLKMIGLFYFLYKALKKGIPLFIDELDSKLHPLLLRYILVNFLNNKYNPNHAQLIFTSHDFSLLNMNLLRRDEIWFVQKENNISELYSLSDFRDPNNNRIRKDKNFLNNYFIGQFGAIPIQKENPIL